MLKLSHVTSIDHPDIDMTLKSMDDYASMNWEDIGVYTQDGIVH